jgi:hypothetical protein
MSPSCTIWAAHRHHVIDQEWTQHQEKGTVAGLDDAALLQPDYRIVSDRAAMGVELAARGERHGVVAALGVSELDAFASGERAGC